MKKKRLRFDELSVYIEQEYRRLATKGIYEVDIKNKIILDAFPLDSKYPVNYEDCIFLKIFTSLNYTHKKKVSFKHCYFLEGILLDGSIASEEIYFINCKIYKDFFAVAQEIKKISILSSNIHKLIISDANIDIIGIGGMRESYIKEISIISSCIKRFHVMNSKVEKISISSLAEKTEIFNCQINSILFHDVRNISNVRLTTCQALTIKGKNSHFGIKNSNLGKAEFFQVDFSSFDEVNIIDSILFECLFINATWSNNIKSFYSDQMDNYKKDRILSKNLLKKIKSKLFKSKIYYRETKEQLKNKREVYKQIKFALSKQGDFVNEQMFHGLEMDTYYKILSWKKYRNISTKFILKLSSLTSNYGQSLLRPMLTLVIVNILLFSWFNYFDGSYFVPLSEIKYSDINNTILQFIQYFLQHLNPLHKIDASSRLGMFIDILNKIVMAYVIYNIIRATRRFIK